MCTLKNYCTTQTHIGLLGGFHRGTYWIKLSMHLLGFCGTRRGRGGVFMSKIVALQIVFFTENFNDKIQIVYYKFVSHEISNKMTDTKIKFLDLLSL